MQLTPPFLVVRPGQAFWVEDRRPDDCSATLQAFREGCFSGAWCYDATGGEWPIGDARLKRRPSLLDRVFPWRRVPVALHIGARVEMGLQEVIAQVADVLRSGNEFCEHLRTPPSEIVQQLQLVRSPAEVIEVARRHA